MNNKNTDSIQNNISFHTSYQNQSIAPLTHATVEPTIDFATISNWRGDKSSEIVISINLSTYELSYNDFIACFYYKPDAAFSINTSNVGFKPLLLTNQSYLSSNNNVFSCDLYNLCIQAFCEKHSVPENTISAFKKIALAKETFKTQSLASVSGTQIGLHWDIVTHNLQTNNKIIYTKDADDFAKVIFQLSYVHYSQVLDVVVQYVFSYKTSIPYYRNVYNNELNKPAVLMSGYTNISQLDTKQTNKKEKLKNVSYQPTEIQYQVLNTNIDADGDNDSVLTKTIVNSENDMKPKNISFFTEEEEEDEDVDDEWRR